MADQLITKIYDKNINFLLGSGASSGLLPTLELALKKDETTKWSLEDLATAFTENVDKKRYAALFMHYYLSCILPAQQLALDTARGTPSGLEVISNYNKFIETIILILQRRKAMERRCNLFTTNYDGCLPFVADEIQEKGIYDFVINDGTRGFRRRTLQARNYNGFLCESGVFDRHINTIPQINLINIHGSVYWKKEDKLITVDYNTKNSKSFISATTIEKISAFSEALMNEEFTIDDLPEPHLTNAEINTFWGNYKSIPIVNPTKWKFNETVYEEQYYQMLRMLSYELEKPNAVLICFGFSFADEHILNLLKRSLSNPHLQVYICCYSEQTKAHLEHEFRGCRNVKLISLDGEKLDFTKFNEKVFSLGTYDPSSSNPLDAITEALEIPEGNPQNHGVA